MSCACCCAPHLQSNPTPGQAYRPPERTARHRRGTVSIQPAPRPGISPLTIRCCRVETASFNPTRPSARNIAGKARRTAPRPRRFNPTRPSARNIAGLRFRGKGDASGFNPTRPSARNIACNHTHNPWLTDVSIQPDPRPGISRGVLDHGHGAGAVSIQPDPRPGISRRQPIRCHCTPSFQSNPTLGQEYRPLTGFTGDTMRLFQSNPTLGQEYRTAWHARKSVIRRFNPTRPSARNIANY